MLKDIGDSGPQPLLTNLVSVGNSIKVDCTKYVLSGGMMFTKPLTACLLVLMVFVGPAYALPPMYPYLESENDQHRECKISNAATSVAAGAALRQKGVEVATRQMLSDDKAIAAYISLAAASLGEEKGCVVHVELSLRALGQVYSEFEKRTLIATQVYCEKGTILGGRPADMQRLVNEEVKRVVGLCVARYAELVSS